MNSPNKGKRPRRARILSIAAAALSMSAACAQTAAPGEGGPRFAISRYEVEGNSLLPPARLESTLAPFAGPDRGFGDVRQAVQALQKAYRDRGYNVVVVQLPEQELDRGVVRMRVIEQRIGRVEVIGNQQFSTANIRASLPGLVEGTTPNIRDISASLKVANTNPAKQTTLDLQSGAAPDTVDATVRVGEIKPWRIGLTADNTGSPETGRTQIGLLLQHANLWGRDDVGTLQYITSAEDPSAVKVWAAGYHLPLYSLGDSMDFFASYANVDSGTVTAGILNLLVSGKGRVAGVRYNHSLPQWREVTQTLIAGFDWRAYDNNIGMDGTDLGNDVTVRPLSLTWAGQMAAGPGQFGLQVTGLQNVKGGKNGTDADMALQRAGATASYRLLRYSANYSQPVASDWQMRLRLNGQVAHDPLIPGEQFGAGGAASVRGFREREVADDNGNFASAEIETPNLCAGRATSLQCSAVGFLDGARLSRNNPLPGEQDSTSISSFGFGLRFMVVKNGALQIDYGQVIKGGGVRSRGDNRVHVALSLNY
jgi:hemolysin activation/secretion protein